MVKIITRAEAKRMVEGDGHGARQSRAKTLGETQPRGRRSSSTKPAKGKSLLAVFSDEAKKKGS